MHDLRITVASTFHNDNSGKIEFNRLRSYVFKVLILLVLGSSICLAINEETEKRVAACQKYLRRLNPDLRLKSPFERIADLCDTYYDFHDIPYHVYTMVFIFLGRRIRDNQLVLFKAIQTDTILFCVLDKDKDMNDPKFIHLISQYDCALSPLNVPVEYFALQSLNGQKGRTPKLYDFYRLPEDKIDIIVMDPFQPFESKIYYSIQDGLWEKEKVRDMARKLITLVVDMVNDCGIVNLDMHISNIFYDKEHGARLINFERIETNVDYDKPGELRLYIGAYETKCAFDVTYLTAPPEFFSAKLKTFEGRNLSTGGWMYIPTRYAVFLIGAAVFHTAVCNRALTYNELNNMFIMQLKFSNEYCNNRDFSPFLDATLATDYFKREGLGQLTTHPFLRGYW